MNIKWNTLEYTKNFDFVHRYGEDVLKLIDAPKGSFVIELGCGNGALSSKLSEMGYIVKGIDASENMIETAKKLYPNIDFEKANILNFNLSKKADVIFSNAVLHWIDAEKQEKAIENISRQLNTGGQFLCEFGGKGCAEMVHSTLERDFEKRGISYPRTFYFPKIGEYSPILENYGFKVEYAVLFDRPTEQKTDNGLLDWINMFVKKPFENMNENIKNNITDDVVTQLKPILYKNNKWFIDYVRIRIKAKRL